MKFKLERGEPVLRSCWKCNTGHEHLKKVNMIHECFICGRSWVFDKFLDELKSAKAWDKFFTGKKMRKGMSTRRIDAGYRVCSITFERKFHS